MSAWSMFKSGLGGGIVCLLIAGPIRAAEEETAVDARVKTVIQGALQHVQRIENIELYVLDVDAWLEVRADPPIFRKRLTRYYWKASKKGFILERRVVRLSPDEEIEEHENYVRVFDGEHFYLYEPDRTLVAVYGPEGLRRVGGKYQVAVPLNVDACAPGELCRWCTMGWLRAEDVRWEYRGTETWRGMVCHKLGRSTKNGRHWLSVLQREFTADSDSEIWVGEGVDFGVVRNRHVVVAEGKEIYRSETEWTDWQEAAGIPFARRRLHFSKYLLPDGIWRVDRVGAMYVTKVSLNQEWRLSPWATYIPVGTTLSDNVTGDYRKIGGDAADLRKLLQDAETPADVLQAVEELEVPRE